MENQVDPNAFVDAMLERLASAVASELGPIINAIATAQQTAHVQLPTIDGHTLVVSVRASAPALNACQMRLVDGAIEEKLGEPISVSMLSSIAGLSPATFSNAFRRSVGRSPREHIHRLKLERAKQMMLETALPLSEIALATGYYDQAHFSNKFRRATGSTPSEWRRLRQETA